MDSQQILGINTKGWVLQQMGQHQEAILVFERIIQIDPKYYIAYYNIAWSLNKLQQYQNAIDMYDQALKLNPRYINAYYQKGLILSLYIAYVLVELNLLEEAIEFYNKIIELDSNYVDAYIQKGIKVCYQAPPYIVKKNIKKRLSSGINLLKLIRIMQTFLVAKLRHMNNRVNTKRQLKTINNQSYNQSQKQVYKQIGIYNCYQAQLYLKLNDNKQAQLNLEQYLKNYPDDKDAQQQLQAINELK
ncbi:hypothetical protein pb186bvf_002054 [Paramecium bursaria]